MPRGVRLFSLNNSRILVQAAAIFAIIVGLILGVALWRVSSAPLDIAFAKVYIESSLRNDERGVYARFESVVLHWPDLTGPLFLEVKGAKVFGPGDHVIVAAGEASLGLSKAALLIGKIAPVALIVKRPDLRLVRDKSGNIDVGFSRGQDVPQLEEQTDFTSRIVEYIAHPDRKSKSPLAALRAFEIKEAKIRIDDVGLGISWYLPRADIQINSLSAGLSSKIYAEFSEMKEGVPSSFRAEFLAPWKSGEAQLMAILTNFDVRSLAEKLPGHTELAKQDVVIDGKADVILDKNFMPVVAQLSVSSAQGSFIQPDLSAEGIPYKDFSFKATYNGENGKFEVSDTRATIRDVTIDASAKLDVTKDKISGPVQLSIAEVNEKLIEPLWPAALKGDNAEEWIVERLTAGILRNVYARMDLSATKTGNAWTVAANKIKAGFDFEDVSVDYRAPLLPVSKARGRGTFDYDQEKLDIKVEEGLIGKDIAVKSANLEFVHIIEAGKGVADIRIKIEGPVKTGFEYLEKEPISLSHKFDVKKIKGNAKATVNVSFPTVKDIKVSDVKVNAEGVLSDVTLPDVVQDLDLTGGPLSFSVKGNQFRLNGSAMIEGRAAALDYRQFLSSAGQDYKMKVSGNVNADSGLRTRLGVDLSYFMEGSAPVDFVYTEFADGRADANATVNLRPLFVFFEPLGYAKQPDLDGSATLKAKFKDGFLQEVYDLEAMGPGLKLEKSNFKFKQVGAETKLVQGRVSRVAAGETVGKVEFDVTDAGQYKIAFDGPFLDLRPSLDKDQDDEAYAEPPMIIAVAAERMRAADDEALEQGKIYVDIDAKGGFNQLQLNAIAGGGEVYLRYKPDASGKRVFRMQADNAGAALKAFGVYNNMRGGKLSVSGDPPRGVDERNIKGKAEIRDFKIVNAPTLASLLSALSLPGMMSLLNKEGLAFSKLEADFDWLYRPRGSLLVFKDGTTSGNSVGFTFDGKYNKIERTVDISGTIIPLSEINKIIGKIPLVGDILTGGSGGVFAATYTIKGDSEKPTVMVNPLSVLTPGILRRILFEKN